MGHNGSMEPSGGVTTSDATSAQRGEIVVVTGADLPVGRRVVVAALGLERVERVVAIGAPGSGRELRRLAAGDDRGELDVVALTLDDPALTSHLRGATRVVLAGPRHGLDLDGTGGADLDLGAVRSLLATLARVADVSTMVVLSSALVYGVRPTNPVPITEAAPVRPNPSIGAAVQRAELERMCTRWAATRGARCAVLRPAVVIGPENGRWLARSPWSTTGLQVGVDPAPLQFVHLDDLTTAIMGLCRLGYDGAINVAADGWLSVDQVAALKGPTLRLRLGRPIAHLVARIGGRVGVAPGHPDTLVAVSAPWVVSNERLRSLGWVPEHSNEEAYVDADRGGIWAHLTPRHRQQLALGGAAVVGLGVLGTIAVLVRRHVLEGRRSR